MSSFRQILNDRGQFIIAIKVIKSPTDKDYQDGSAESPIIDAEPKMHVTMFNGEIIMSF